MNLDSNSGVGVFLRGLTVPMIRDQLNTSEDLGFRPLELGFTVRTIKAMLRY